MNLEREVRKMYDRCIQMGRYQPHELLRWLVWDVLAGFGINAGEPPPKDLSEWLFEQGREYAGVVTRAPFADALGTLYQLLASTGHRSGLGQYFTPEPLADFMAQVAAEADAAVTLKPSEPDRLLRLCEPACGSGALVLGFLRQLLAREGRTAARRWSITAIDLDSLCAQICATQVLANAYIGQIDLGELVVYTGNALGPPDALRVVVHASARDQRPDLVLPALHPSRLAALREATAQVAPVKRTPDGSDEEGKLPPSPSARRVSRTGAPAQPARHADDSQVDLFNS